MRNVVRYLFIALTTCFFIVANYVNSYHICGCFLTKLIICIWFSLLNLRTHPQRPWSFSWKSLPLNHFFFLWVNILKRIPLRNTMQNFGFPTRGFPRFWRFIYYYFFFLPLPLCYQPKGYTCQVTFAQIMQMNGIILYEKCNQSQLNII